MVAFYKHDIAAWRGGTASLTHEQYRVYHVLVEQMMLEEGSILVHERMLSGLANMSTRSFRAVVDQLVRGGKVYRDGDRLACPRMPVRRWERAPLGAALRGEVLERDGFTCVYCGAENDPLEVDHIHPVARGGFDHIDNLVTSCRSCNRSKGARLLEEWVQ